MQWKENTNLALRFLLWSIRNRFFVSVAKTSVTIYVFHQNSPSCNEHKEFSLKLILRISASKYPLDFYMIYTIFFLAKCTLSHFLLTSSVHNLTSVECTLKYAKTHNGTYAHSTHTRWKCFGCFTTFALGTLSGVPFLFVSFKRRKFVLLFSGSLHSVNLQDFPKSQRAR